VPIEPERGWNTAENHQSQRSWQAVVLTIQMIQHIQSLKGSPVGLALQNDKRIVVRKGIHDDRIGAHITLQIDGDFETYHVYLTPKSINSKEFEWRPALVCTGSEAFNADVRRLPFQTGEWIYKVEHAHYV
jgi:hypothetical protein